MPELVEYPKKYDVIVIGAGHAGCEAALASARLGCETLLLTIYLDTIAFMSCNPAMGGPAKSQLIREVDALGGEIGIATDKTFLQMKMLNTAKGPAVQSLRAQSDRADYHRVMKRMLEEQENLDLKQAIVDDILLDDAGHIRGIKTHLDVIYLGKVVVVTTGTFMKGLIHTGLKNMPAGRSGELASDKLSESLASLGLKIGRLKTGTTPRLDKRTIDFSKMKVQPGDEPPKMFSFIWEYNDYGLDAPDNPQAKLEQVPCYLTHTNKKTHEVIKANLDRSPLYRGVIKGVGPRYCPSIEDKVVRFPDKERHQIFMEPTGRDTTEIYPSGTNTSLPEDVQLAMLKTMPGLENVEVMRPGYAIEYDFVYPSQITHSLETRKVPGLFLAGQVNGTSGYEEAAAQGVIAGINAAMKVKGKEALILGRHEAYIGTLIDDLITKEIDEPYRMLTSRSEYRLLLRQDNADLRLTEKGHKVGLISKERFVAFKKKNELIDECLKVMRKGKTPRAPEAVIEQAAINLKYDGYIKRQFEQVARFKRLEGKKIPVYIDYKTLSGLSNESRIKLDAIKPISVGQASRIAGVSPADIAVLMVHMETRRRTSGDQDIGD